MKIYESESGELISDPSEDLSAAARTAFERHRDDKPVPFDIFFLVSAGSPVYRIRVTEKEAPVSDKKKIGPGNCIVCGGPIKPEYPTPRYLPEGPAHHRCCQAAKEGKRWIRGL